MDELGPTHLEELGSALHALHTELTTLVRDDSGLTNTVTLDQSAVGRVSRIDAIQQQAMAKATQARHAQRLDRVEAALERLASDPDEFGWCPDCGELIAWKRLQSSPDAVLCVKCATARGL